MGREKSRGAHPRTIPKGFEWVGGSDGGVWIKTKRLSDKEIQCEILWQSGLPAETGVFYRRVGKFGSKVDFTAYDGSRVIVEGNLVLSRRRKRK